ncbi:MAG: hypothetical protein K8T10_12185 [Candidatus Eremiobacteraeota bacterium]|nr:hypothetical protein [Candidatus Eremiobacteraeota bacterium]
MMIQNGIQGIGGIGCSGQGRKSGRGNGMGQNMMLGSQNGMGQNAMSGCQNGMGQNAMSGCQNGMGQNAMSGCQNGIGQDMMSGCQNGIGQDAMSGCQNGGKGQGMQEIMQGVQDGSISQEELQSLMERRAEKQEMEQNFMSDGQMTHQEKMQMRNYCTQTKQMIDQLKQG